MSQHLVAVYWPGLGYGCATRANDIEHARKLAQDDLKLGYGQVGKSEVHIILHTPDEVVEKFTQPRRYEPVHEPRRGRAGKGKGASK